MPLNFAEKSVTLKHLFMKINCIYYFRVTEIRVNLRTIRPVRVS